MIYHLTKYRKTKIDQNLKYDPKKTEGCKISHRVGELLYKYEKNQLNAYERRLFEQLRQIILNPRDAPAIERWYNNHLQVCCQLLAKNGQIPSPE